MGVVSSSLSLSVGALYVRKYFDEEAKKNVVEMVTGIRKEFRKIIEKVSLADFTRYLIAVYGISAQFPARDPNDATIHE